MLKHLFVLAAVAAATAPACALGTGDLAFTAFNADEDVISMVTGCWVRRSATPTR